MKMNSEHTTKLFIPNKRKIQRKDMELNREEVDIELTI